MHALLQHTHTHTYRFLSGCKEVDKQLSYGRETTLQRGSVVVHISTLLFYVFKEHCCRLLLQLVSPVNRQQLKCHRMQQCRANGWFSSRTKFVFRGMSPTNYLCTDRQASKCLTTLPLTVFAQSNFVADFLRDIERKRAKNGHFAFLTPLRAQRQGTTLIIGSLESAQWTSYQ